MKYAYYNTKIGIIEIAYLDIILSIKLVDNKTQKDTKNAMTDLVYKEICEYLDGFRREFSVYDLLEIRGSDFRKSVIKALKEIPYGKTTSYKKIAEKINNPKALRAVGTAIGKNPFLIIYPCHRVIKSDGRIGAFAYGTKLKRYLLDIEGAKYKNWHRKTLHGAGSYHWNILIDSFCCFSIKEVKSFWI